MSRFARVVVVMAAVTAAIFLNGCGGGLGLTQSVEISQLHPSPGAANVPLDIVPSFRVAPANAWVELRVVYIDEQGRARNVYFQLWKEEVFWNQARYYVQFWELLRPDTEYSVWVRGSRYDYRDRVIPGDRWRFTTSS